MHTNDFDGALRQGRFAFECLMGRGWVNISPAIVIYDLTNTESAEVDTIETVIENLQNGAQLKGKSGATYRLINIGA